MKHKLIILAFILTGTPLFSQTIVTDRPDQTESSFAVPKGAFQIETGILVEQYNEFGEVHNTSLPFSLFRYGLLKNLELRAVHSFNHSRTEYYNGEFKRKGTDDIELGAKFQFLGDETSNTHMAILSHVVFPTGSRYFSENAYQSLNRLLISHSFEDFAIGYNLGINYGASEEFFYTYSFSIAKPINDQFSIFVETFGELDTEFASTSNIDGGMAYLLNDKMQLDFAFGTGVDNFMNYFTIGYSALITKNEE